MLVTNLKVSKIGENRSIWYRSIDDKLDLPRIDFQPVANVYTHLLSHTAYEPVDLVLKVTTFKIF